MLSHVQFAKCLYQILIYTEEKATSTNASLLLLRTFTINDVADGFGSIATTAPVLQVADIK